LGAISGGGKNVVLIGSTGNITLQVWAQITNAAPVAGAPFGVQGMEGSIITSGISGTVTGALSPVTPAAPFTFVTQNGLPGEYSSPADTIGDVGFTGTVQSTNFILTNKDTNSGGTLVGAVFYASNLAPAGATVNPITNGFEFLMATVTLSITNYTAGSRFNVNWAIPGFTQVAAKGSRAAWTGADNASDNGSAQSAFMTVNATGITVGVPEPSAFAMVGLGALGLLGFRRMGLRRTV